MQYWAEHSINKSRPNNMNMHGWLLKHRSLCRFYHSLLKKAYQIYHCCGTFTGERRLNLLGFKSSIVCNYHHLQKWYSMFDTSSYLLHNRNSGIVITWMEQLFKGCCTGHVWLFTGCFLSLITFKEQQINDLKKQQVRKWFTEDDLKKHFYCTWLTSS